MLQIQPKEPDLWESVLPEELKKLPEELARVDELLKNEAFMEPFLKKFSPTMGRPGTPIYTYLRMMYLKFRYKLGYETLVKEVSDSFTWRRFCGIAYTESVPDDSTLIKLTHEFGEEALSDLHRLLIADLITRKLVRGKKIRSDTTVVSSDIHYPTDSGLLYDGLRRLKQKLARVRGVGLRLGRTMKKARKMIFAIAQALRKTDAKSKEKVKKLNRRMIKVVRKTLVKVKRVLRRVKDRRARRHLETTLALSEQVANQSEERLNGGQPSDRLVSLADIGARPIAKGKLDKPCEFGRTAELTQDESGYFTGYGVHRGNPGDSRLLPGIISEHQNQFGCAPDSIACDMGFSSKENHQFLLESGVRQIGIAWRGKPPPEIRAKQKRKWFASLKAWRSGMEGSISFLSRKFGLKRSFFRGDAGTAIWVGWCVIAANLYRFGQGP